MKVLLINGSPHKDGCTYTALKEIAGQLEKEGIDSEIYHIGTGAHSPSRVSLRLTGVLPSAFR